MVDWKKTDPRHEVYKRGTIIIVRGRAYSPRTSMGTVETKHSYFVRTEFSEPYDHIGEGDEWA